MHNLIRNFKDGVDTIKGPGGNTATYAVDICYNEIYNCTDDGIELDFSFCNTRAYGNRITNCHQGISFQPIFGGPAYAFRNALFNINMEPFKLHPNGNLVTCGGVILHNTSFKAGMPVFVWAGKPIYNFTILNNLYVGTKDKYAAEYIPANTPDCRLDGNIYVVELTQPTFIKWNNTRYTDLSSFTEATGNEKHGMHLTSSKGVFLKEPPEIDDPYAKEFSPDQNDLRIAPDSPAVDKALRLYTINDGFAGKAPDIGCYEAGDKFPAYGPRELRK